MEGHRDRRLERKTRARTSTRVPPCSLLSSSRPTIRKASSKMVLRASISWATASRSSSSSSSFCIFFGGGARLRSVFIYFFYTVSKLSTLLSPAPLCLRRSSSRHRSSRGRQRQPLHRVPQRAPERLPLRQERGDVASGDPADLRAAAFHFRAGASRWPRPLLPPLPRRARRARRAPVPRELLDGRLRNVGVGLGADDDGCVPPRRRREPSSRERRESVGFFDRVFLDRRRGKGRGGERGGAPKIKAPAKGKKTVETGMIRLLSRCVLSHLVTSV